MKRSQRLPDRLIQGWSGGKGSVVQDDPETTAHHMRRQSPIAGDGLSLARSRDQKRQRALGAGKPSVACPVDPGRRVSKGAVRFKTKL